MITWRIADVALVRARLAAGALGDAPTPRMLGTILLRAHQCDAAGRLRRALLRFGGALLADDVGLGKTYTALAAADGLGRLLVVGPASLRFMWRQSLDATGMHADFLSFETLSRRVVDRASGRHASTETVAYDVVIVDEAHHARNPATRRYANLAALTESSRVLLLSATPVHNARDDLDALLALFLGSRVRQAVPGDLAAAIVRRTHGDVRLVGTPARAPPIWLQARTDSAVLAAVLEIPPASPPRDGGVANALVTLGLVRAWSSTDAALRATLRRRVARADSLADALIAGRHPTSLELRAWVVGDDATQLAFPELVTQDRSRVDTSELLDLVSAHAAGGRRALRALAQSKGCADHSRRELLRRVRADHAGRRMVVFSQYAESVRAMFSHLVQDGGVCAVTAHGAVVAGGRLSRAEALARFAPRALRVRPPSRADVITMLIATDLLSEGLNLQDAAVVVHLDLPWTPARLAQRMGRVWRLGSDHTDVFEYAIAPPPPAERIAAVITRLHEKAVAARTAMGIELSPLLHPLGSPSSTHTQNRTGAESPARLPDVPGASEQIRQLLLQWLEQLSHVRPEDGSTAVAVGDEPSTIVAAVRAPFDGWLAAVATGQQVRLVGRRLGDDATTDPTRLLTMVRAAGGVPCAARPASSERAAAELNEFLRFTTAATVAGLADSGSSAHARISSRIACLVAASPPHRRAAISRLAAKANRAISGVAGAGVERALARLLRPTEDATEGLTEPEQWLQRITELARSARLSAEDDAGHTVVPAILLLSND